MPCVEEKKEKKEKKNSKTQTRFSSDMGLTSPEKPQNDNFLPKRNAKTSIVAEVKKWRRAPKLGGGGVSSVYWWRRI